MNIRFNAWMAVACCLLAGPAKAATGEDEINSYVSLNGGVTRASNACANTFWVTAGNPCSEKYYGYRLAYGYQFTPVWGFELSYGDFGYAEAKVPFNSIPTGPGVYTWSLKATGWAAFGTATINLGKRFALFGKLGAARPEFREEALLHATGGTFVGTPTAGGASTHAAAGAGAQVNFTPAFALRAQYEWFGKYDIYNIYGAGLSLPKVTLSMASLGLLYKF